MYVYFLDASRIAVWAVDRDTAFAHPLPRCACVLETGEHMDAERRGQLRGRPGQGAVGGDEGGTKRGR